MRNYELVPGWIRARIPSKLKALIPAEWRGKRPPLYDLGSSTVRLHVAPGQRPKRALVSFITLPFRLSPDDPRNAQFSNMGIARYLVKALNELGYVVDLVEWKDESFVPKTCYDLFVGHGGRNFGGISGHLEARTPKILFCSGIFWREFNRMEEERFLDLENRRGVRLPYDRRIRFEEETANRTADAIICLGNQSAKDTYRQFPVVYNLNNAAYHDQRYGTVEKDFALGRDGFLFFAGSGNVHKGLDLLLEAFVRLSAQLYICQRIEPDFGELYHHELVDCGNIHLVGPIPMRSQRFYELVDRCNYVIHPSCAEGQPGAVVECMHQGLIPVLSRQSNIDTDDFGVTLGACPIEEITQTVAELCHKPPEWCAEKSRHTRRVALQEYSETAFLQNFKSGIEWALARAGSLGS